MPPTSYALDLERQAGLDIRASLQITENVPDIQDRAGQGCFLCLESPREGQHAALVPCLRPAEVCKVVGPQRIMMYEKIMPWNRACESDSDIYRRLVDTSYQYLGWWKRWLPYYGINEVLEVNVRLYTFVLVESPDVVQNAVPICWCCRTGWALSYPDGFSEARQRLEKHSNT